jgi:hypothetical protein
MTVQQLHLMWKKRQSIALMMEAVSVSKTSVKRHQTTGRNIQKRHPRNFFG